MELNEKVKTKKVKIMNKIEALLEKKDAIKEKIIELEAKENPSDTQEMRLIEREDKVNEQLERIEIYFFDPNISLKVPAKLLELCNIVFIAEEVKYYEEILKETDYSELFIKINASEIEYYLKPNRNLKKIKEFRSIIENEKIELCEKIKRINKWKFWNKSLYKDFISRESRYNESELKRRKITFGDFLVYNQFTNLGLPFALQTYSMNFKTKKDFMTRDISSLLELEGMGSKRKEKLLSFIEKVKDTEDFDYKLFKLDSIEVLEV